MALVSNQRVVGTPTVGTHQPVREESFAQLLAMSLHGIIQNILTLPMK
jgi:hypothetical protein